MDEENPKRHQLYIKRKYKANQQKYLSQQTSKSFCVTTNASNEKQ